MEDIPSTKYSQKLTGSLMLLLFLIACSLPGLNNRPPTTGTQYSNHILVSLTDPQDGDAFPISAGLSLRSEAISDGPIARLELWADGSLYETYPAPEEELGYLVHYWAWSPKTLGPHKLMVRAYNLQEQTAFSNVVNIRGIEDPGFVLVARAKDGENGIRAAPEPGSTSLLSTANNEWSSKSDFRPQAALAAPSLKISGQGCGATLFISDSADGEKGFNVYRLSPGAAAFSKIKTLPAHTGGESFSYQDPNLYGLYQYYVTALDDSGEAASNLVSVNSIDSNCAGVPVKIDDLASIPAGIEDYYLYVTINNGLWRRFPADEFTFLKRSQELDFNQVASSLAPNLAGSFPMRGEVWGMFNGTPTLLGTFDRSFKSGQPPSMIQTTGIQNFLKTKLEVRGVFNPSQGDYPWYVNKGMSYDTQLFRFGTDTTAQYGIWQVSSVPFAPGADFKPACLLLTGKTGGSGTPALPVIFTIDFSPLKPTIKSIKLSPFESSYSQMPAFFPPFQPEKLTPSGQQTVTIPKWNSGKLSQGNTSLALAPSRLDPCAQNVSGDGVVTYYVRIIPVSNGQPSGNPSNTVIMTYNPNGQIQISIPHVPIPNLTYYDVKILNFTGVHVPDLTYEFCVVVVKNNYSGIGPWTALEPGDVLCPASFKGGNEDILDQLSGAVADAFNFIAGLYNKLSDWVTDLVDELNPLCIQAKLASQAVEYGEGEVKDACHFIAVAAVTAAKTYAGLPPSLPNFDELTEVGKDNLVELAAQELEDQGIPCPEDCKDVIRKGIDYSLEQVKAGMSNSSCMSEEQAHENGIEPLCLPSGITTQPDPRGQPAPAVLEVEITRRPGTTGANIPEPKSCTVGITSYAVNSSHLGESYSTSTDFKWQGAEIKGNLLTGSGAFPNLKPNESTTIPIILSPVPYWLPGHWEFAKTNWKPENFDDWGLLYQGATATIDVNGTCKFVFPEGAGISYVAVNGDSTQVGPLGDAWSPTCHPYNCP